MAIAFGSAGAAAGTVGTTLTVTTAASAATNDLLILAICNKYPTNSPATPSGWTLSAQTSGGKGSSGNASGDVYGTVFTKVSTGSEPASVAVTITGNNDAVGRMFRYTCGAGKTWVISETHGTYAGGNFEHWVAIGNANPALVSGDMVVAVSASNGPRTYASEAITCTGITFGTVTERGDDWDLDGDNVSMAVSEHPVSSGTSLTAATFSMEGSGSGTNDPAGVTVMLDLHELSGFTETMDVGTFTLTGEDVGQGTGEDVGVGTFTLTGQDVLPDGSELMDVGIFALTGQDVTSTTGTVGGTTANPVAGDNLASVQPMMKEVYRFGRLGGGLFN